MSESFLKFSENVEMKIGLKWVKRMIIFKNANIIFLELQVMQKYNTQLWDFERNFKKNTFWLMPFCTEA